MKCLQIGLRRAEMIKIVVVIAGLVVAVLAGVKDHHLLQRVHLVGSCTSIPAPAGDTAHWQACRGGKLVGPPDLTRNSCRRVRVNASAELWRCPERVASAPTAGA